MLRKIPFKIISVVFLFMLGTLVYSNTLKSSFHFDDISFIVENPAIRNIGNLGALWNYWPTRFTGILSLAINYHFHQLNVFGYHIVNLLIHIFSAFLVIWLMQLTFQTPGMKGKEMYKNYISFFASLIFLIHPVQTEAVNYVFQRVTLLAAFFYLLSLCLYIKSALLRQIGAPLSKFCYFSSLAAALIAMFSKEIAFTIPFTILLYQFCFLREENKAGWRPVMPFFVLLPVIPLAILSLKPLVFMNVQKLLENPAANSSGYLFTQFRVLATYLRLFIFPVRQNLDYDYSISASLWEIPVLSSFLFLSVILIAGMRIFSKHRLISFGILWFFITLLPESSIIPLTDVIYEHRLYLPIVGLSIFAASIIYCLFAKKNPVLARSVLMSLIILYSALTFNRNFIWRDELSLWNDAVNKSPKKLRPYNERGLAYLDKGDFDSAILDFTRAVDLNPAYADGFYNRGLSYFKKSDFDNAILDFTQAIKLKKQYQKAYYNRGLAYYNKKKYDLAVIDFKQVISITPNFIVAYYYLGGSYGALGKSEEAMVIFNKARKISVRHYCEIADKYKDSGKYKEAAAYYMKALEFEPRNLSLLDGLAGIYIVSGRFKDAIGQYKKILEVEPDLAAAHNNLAVAYYYDKQYDLAIEQIETAQKLGYKVAPKLLGFIKPYRKQKN